MDQPASKSSGGKTYLFSVQRKTSNIDLARRSAIVRIIWLNDSGGRVLRPDPTFHLLSVLGQPPRAEPEFPKVIGEANGWTQLEGVYHVPPDATEAQVELHFRWGPPNSSVHWSMPKLVEVAAPEPRTVRLATVHYQPRSGKTPREKCEQFAPLIAEAAEKDVDLIVLPETLTYYGTKGTYIDVAEPIPGPSTDYFGSLAKKHDLYIVAGLVERDQHLAYNVAVLLGPGGDVVGKYRKVTLPPQRDRGRDHSWQRLSSLRDSLRQSRHDGLLRWFLSRSCTRADPIAGAEVIAFPVWGCNPMLAAARACENHVYVISSTYTDAANNWMISAIFGHDGKPLAQAEDWGSLAIAEVDLNQPLYWHSLGDFQAQIQAHRPLVKTTP